MKQFEQCGCVFDFSRMGTSAVLTQCEEHAGRPCRFEIFAQPAARLYYEEDLNGK